MKPLAIINPENVSEEDASGYKYREAARAIVFDGEGKVALLHVTKKHYYKLPGGGIDEGESKEEALKRECFEEIGCAIEITRELGSILEYRKQHTFKQLSYCYAAKLVGEKGIPELTESEIAEGFEAVWLSPEEAIRMVRTGRPTNYEGPHIIERDALFLEAASR